MFSLIFKFCCWQYGCRPSIILFNLKIFLILILLLILIIIFYFIDHLFWKNRLKTLIEFQENYCRTTAALLDIAKITILSINRLKNHLTSLRLILDSFEDPNFLIDRQMLNKYLMTADNLLFKIKQRGELLNKQLFPTDDIKLFALTEEINSLLYFYQDIFKQNSIKLEFNSVREYRIFANQDQLLRIINTLLLNSVESLMLVEKKEKQLKIYFKRTPYLLKVYIETNTGIIPAKSIRGLIKIACVNDDQLSQLQLSLFYVNRRMKKYFHKNIEIFNRKNQKTIICMKIKSSFILAEPKIQ
jgi:hypothetical protein